MAADTVTPFDRGLEPKRRPFRAQNRADRRRAAFVVRISHARTPAEKLSIAFDYFRGTVTDHRIDDAAKAAACDDLVHHLIERADHLTKTLRRNR